MKFYTQNSMLLGVTMDDPSKGITLPDTITALSPRAFYDLPAVPFIRLSPNIVSIPDGCFENVKAVNIFLPDKLVSIGNNAFKGSTIICISLPDSIEEIGEYAFASCKQLEEIRWPMSLKKLGTHALFDCTSLRHVEADPSLLSRPTLYPLYSYYDGIESFVIPNGVKRLYKTAFQGCHLLRSLTIPDSVMHIGEHAFADCSALQEIVLPELLTDVHRLAFINCPSLLRITLSREAFFNLKLMKEEELSATTAVVSVKKKWLADPASPFINCRSLQKIILYRDKALIDAAKQKKAEDKAKGIWEDTFFVYQNAENGTVLTKCKKTDPKQLTIPAFVTSIHPDAFSSCRIIRNLTFEEGFTRLDTSVFEKTRIQNLSIPCSLVEICGPGFAGLLYTDYHNYWRYFPNLIIPENHPRFCAKGDYFILEKTDNGLRTIFFLQFNRIKDCISIPDGTTCVGSKTFNNFSCKSIIVPSSVREIEADAFYNANINTLTIEDGCKRLDDGWANKLTLVSCTIPGSVEYIGDSPKFLPSPSGSFTCVENSVAHTWLIDTFSSSIDISFLRKQSTQQPAGQASAAENDIRHLFVIRKNKVTRYLGTTLTRLDLNDLVKDTPDISFLPFLFESHHELREVILPEGMAVLPEGFFRGCSGLTSVHLPTSMRTLSAFAFSRCESITALVIPDQVTNIDYTLFGSHIRYPNLQIFGKPGSAAELYAAATKNVFIDNSDETLTALTDIFSWVYTGNTVGITDIKHPDSPEPLIIPDTIGNHRVVSLNSENKPGRRKVVIGRYLKDIFVSLSDVTEIVIPPENKSIILEDGLLYTKAGHTLTEILPSAFNARSITIREGTKDIPPLLFVNCTRLRELHIPSSLPDVSMINLGLKSKWEDPLIIFGRPESGALKLAQYIRCVYVDLSLPADEQQLSITFKMLPIRYSIQGGGYTTYGYATHGYTGTDKEIHIPSKIGTTAVTTIVQWCASNVPDTTYIPETVVDILDRLTMLAKKQVIVAPGNPKFVSAGGQLYDSNHRMFYCPEECCGTPALPGVTILCAHSFHKQNRHELIIDKPLRILGNLFTEGHLDRLVIRAAVNKVVLDPGLIDTVVIPESMADQACLFGSVRFISIVASAEPGAPEICRLAGPALRHAENIKADPERLLDGRSLSDYLDGKFTLDLPWLIRRHDEAFESIRKADTKIDMAMLRLINPYLLDEKNAGHFRRYLQHSMKRCVEMLCEADDYELFRGLCKTGLIHRQNVKKLIEITTDHNKTEWTALLLQSAHK